MGDERVMEIGRLVQPEQGLQQALGRGRRAQILAAHDQGDARRRIVDDAGEMIGGRRVLAGEDGIAEIAMLAFEPDAAFLAQLGNPARLSAAAESSRQHEGRRPAPGSPASGRQVPG